MSISRINNPDFAEKLMNSFFSTANMSADEINECEKIWVECNNNRSDVLKKVVEICGEVINTPQTRYLKAISWSFNSTKYSKERIEAINNYLSNHLYYKAFKNNVITLDYGMNKGEKFHRAMFLQYLATAYNSIKDYDNCEKCYKKIIDLGTKVPNGYILLADFYRKRSDINLAIATLISAKKTIKYFTDKEYRISIDNKLNDFEKLKQGIRKHKFTFYDTYPSTWINNTYRKDLETAHLELRQQYSNFFDQHRKFLEYIEKIEFSCKLDNTDYFKNEEYEDYCIKDLELYPKIKEFYTKLNLLGFGYHMEYEDNRHKEYITFKKLINYYIKRKEYENAIIVCQKAKEVGENNYTSNVSMDDEISKIEKKMLQ